MWGMGLQLGEDMKPNTQQPDGMRAEGSEGET
jgi:hypothetical protein